MKNFRDSSVPYFILFSIVSSRHGSSGSLWTTPFLLARILLSKSALTFACSLSRYRLPQGSQIAKRNIAITVLRLKSLMKVIMKEIMRTKYPTKKIVTTVAIMSYKGDSCKRSNLWLAWLIMSRTFPSFKISWKRFAWGSRLSIDTKYY